MFTTPTICSLSNYSHLPPGLTQGHRAGAQPPLEHKMDGLRRASQYHHRRLKHCAQVPLLLSSWATHAHSLHSLCLEDTQGLMEALLLLWCWSFPLSPVLIPHFPVLMHRLHLLINCCNRVVAFLYPALARDNQWPCLWSDSPVYFLNLYA